MDKYGCDGTFIPAWGGGFGWFEDILCDEWKKTPDGEFGKVCIIIAGNDLWRGKDRCGELLDSIRRWNLDPDIHSAICLLYTSPSPRDRQKSRMPSSA